VSKGEKHEYYFDHNIGSVAVRGIARMALQPKLGIWWKWSAWVSFAPDNSWLAIRLPIISAGRILRSEKMDCGFDLCRSQK
jgi:hypothetical protein